MHFFGDYIATICIGLLGVYVGVQLVCVCVHDVHTHARLHACVCVCCYDVPNMHTQY